MSARAAVEVEGLSVSYQLAGDGPALVLLHRFTYDSRAWRAQIEALSDQFTVVAWDAPGAGHSSDPPETSGISDWADYLDAFLATIQVEKAHVLGLSWGGILAQEFYSRYPDRVLSLILADTYAAGKAPSPSRSHRNAWKPACEIPHCRPRNSCPSTCRGCSARPSLTRSEMRRANAMSEFHPAGFRLMAMSPANTDTRRLLPSIKVPTLLIWGENDARSPITVAHQFREAIPGSELVIIPGAGHVSNMEQPELFNAAVGSFCLGLAVQVQPQARA